MIIKSLKLMCKDLNHIPYDGIYFFQIKISWITKIVLLKQEHESAHWDKNRMLTYDTCWYEHEVSYPTWVYRPRQTPNKK